MLGWWRGTKPQISYPQSASLNSNLAGASTWCFSVPLILGLCWQRSEQFEHQVWHGLSWLLVLVRFRDMGTAYGKHGIPELGFGCTWGVGAGKEGQDTDGSCCSKSLGFAPVPPPKWGHSLLTMFRTFCRCHDKEVLRDVFFSSE